MSVIGTRTSSMCPITTSVGAPSLERTRTNDDPCVSDQTSPNCAAASRQMRAGSSSWPDGPRALSRSWRSCGVAIAPDSAYPGHMTALAGTDLLTPLAAYLRLRAGGRASFLLESVEQGRLGRHSSVGFGDRIVSFDEADGLDAPVVGSLGYDHVAVLEPTVSLPADGPAL